MSNKAKQLGVELRAEAIKLGVWPCCLNCEHWSEVQVITDTSQTYFECGKYKTIPPAETIAAGCNQHIPYIPF